MIANEQIKLLSFKHSGILWRTKQVKSTSSELNVMNFQSWKPFLIEILSETLPLGYFTFSYSRWSEPSSIKVVLPSAKMLIAFDYDADNILLTLMRCFSKI